MTIDNRDTRPATDRHAEIESAYDARVLAALAAAWSMARDRRLVAGDYWVREDIDALAADLAEPLEPGQAADVIGRLAAAQDSPAGLVVDSDAILDKIWDVIA